jgi:GNAT superfamily N-acetyltransferase
MMDCLSTETFQIREAQPSDSAALSELSAQLGYPVPADVMAERVRQLEPGEHAVFVAESEGHVVGWIDVGLVFHLQSGTRAEIGGLVVAESERSRGVGRQLLHRAEEWARKRGMTEVLLRSNSKRADAHRFYLRENYTQTKLSAVFLKKL